MEEMLRKELVRHGCFTGKLPDIVEVATKCITNPTVPSNLKIMVAVSELLLLVSHYQKKILHPNSSLIPINGIFIGLAGSGASKDSSIKAVRNGLVSSYSKLEDYRKQVAILTAQDMAKEAGEPEPEEWSNYKDYYVAPVELFAAISTPEGFIHQLNILEKEGIGSGFIYSGEFSSELANSGIISDLMKLLAETYDMGDKAVKIIRGKDTQNKRIHNMPVSATFLSSYDGILFNQVAKSKFALDLKSAMARRCFFMYVDKEVPRKLFDDVLSMLNYKKELLEESNKHIKKLNTLDVSYLETTTKTISISDEAMEVVLTYESYNFEVSDSTSVQYPITKLARKHYWWKAMKLAGGFALLRGSNSIEIEDYIGAINFTELLDDNLLNFEIELQKEPYEQFASYMQIQGYDAPFNITIHMLKKLGYIPQGNNVNKKMEDLHKSVSSYDNTGVYKITDKGISYERLIDVNALSLSYQTIDTDDLYATLIACRSTLATKKDVSDAKGYIAKRLGKFHYIDIDFKTLGIFLLPSSEGNISPEDNLSRAYSPFAFKDGIRGRDNITKGCGFIVLDIDNSNITDEECHLMLEEYNHHIVRTSDYTNAFKFRVLLELDKLVDIPNKQWSKFLKAIGRDLGLNIDILPKSQIFYSYTYGDRKLLSQLEGIALNSLKYIKESVVIDEPIKVLNKTQQTQLLKQRLDTFDFAFEADNGTGSVSLIRAARYAKDLGATKEEIVELIWEINDYWTIPMDTDRVENTIISQVLRWS